MGSEFPASRPPTAESGLGASRLGSALPEGSRLPSAKSDLGGSGAT